MISALKSELDATHTAREAALALSRKLIQCSSKCIKHCHRHQFAEAAALLEEAKAISAKCRESVKDHPQIQHGGFVQDAEKEMVEAACVLAMTQDVPLPTAAELGVDAASYLNGVAEAASEGRRFLLDQMRKGNMADAEAMLAQMEAIYDDLIGFDYPDALTGGLRRTCDALRAVIERTRSDFAMTVIQHDLLTELKRR